MAETSEADDEEIMSYAQRLLSPIESNQKLIQTILEKLSGYSVTPQTARNPISQQAWELLDQFTHTIQPALRTAHGVLWVFGSTLYDDPKNNDFDVLITTEKHYPHLIDLTDTWTDRLNTVWTIGEQGHITYLDLETLTRHCDAIHRGDIDYVKDRVLDIELDFEDASVVFNGYPLYVSNNNLLSTIPARVATLIQQEPLFATIMSVGLEETLAARRERRSQT